MGVSSKTAAVAKMHGHGVMIDALLGGTEAMRAAGKAYLPQWPQEEDDGYQARLGTSTLLPVLSHRLRLAHWSNCKAVSASLTATSKMQNKSLPLSTAPMPR